uniref:Uncharacterized protein n=1 Tax=Anguilla anguilla TaxID=7936 RepID=A0A0E9RMR5_ANGAN
MFAHKKSFSSALMKYIASYPPFKMSTCSMYHRKLCFWWLKW